MPPGFTNLFHGDFGHAPKVSDIKASSFIGEGQEHAVNITRQTLRLAGFLQAISLGGGVSDTLGHS